MSSAEARVSGKFGDRFQTVFGLQQHRMFKHRWSSDRWEDNTPELERSSSRAASVLDDTAASARKAEMEQMGNRSLKFLIFYPEELENFSDMVETWRRYTWYR